MNIISLARSARLFSGARALRPRLFHRTASVQEVVEFKLADIGEGIAEVEVLEWYVSEGQAVQQFDKICEVQSDKATVDITSRYDGTVTKIGHEVGDMAAVGSVLVEIETGVAAAAAPSAAPADAPPSPAPSAAGAAAAAAPETTITSPRVLERRRSIGGKTLATPSVRRLAKEHTLDLEEVLGTGKDGRVLKSDVLEYIKALEQDGAATPAAAAAADPAPVPAAAVPPSAAAAAAAPLAPPAPRAAADVVVPVRGIQRQMVKSMTQSLLIPHFNLMDEICMDNLVELRQELKPLAESRYGVKLTYMPLLLKATSLALLQFPSLNATINTEATEVVHRASHNISVAMDTPRGLLVPSVTDVQDKSVFEIAGDLVRLQQLGADNKLGAEELSGGTFSLSNIGNIGATYTSPVIMAPQVAIGALGSIRRLPRFGEDGETVVASNVMNVSWAADHRVVDGATMARFNKAWKGYLESPLSMLSDMR